MSPKKGGVVDFTSLMQLSKESGSEMRNKIITVSVYHHSTQMVNAEIACSYRHVKICEDQDGREHTEERYRLIVALTTVLYRSPSAGEGR